MAFHIIIFNKQGKLPVNNIFSTNITLNEFLFHSVRLAILNIHIREHIGMRSIDHFFYAQQYCFTLLLGYNTKLGWILCHFMRHYWLTRISLEIYICKLYSNLVWRCIEKNTTSDSITYYVTRGLSSIKTGCYI